MSFWSGETLEIRLPGLIEGFSRDQIDCAAYTLRVGSEVFISPSTAVEAATKTKLLLKEDEGFAIPPGQFALVLTEESVEVPKSAVAFISMKARIKFKGLVNVSGFHVDPGPAGRRFGRGHTGTRPRQSPPAAWRRRRAACSGAPWR